MIHPALNFRIGMERYKLILAYDGTEFLGSQRQGSRRTVQGEVESALRSLGWQDASILLAGRTDTGVHATGQVAAFDLEWKHPIEDLKAALNSRLPGDISVWKVESAASGFHPRFDARARCYHYRVIEQKERNPVQERYAWRIEEAVTSGLLDKAAKRLIGKHDFMNFGRAMHAGNSTVRTVFAAGWYPQEKHSWIFQVIADAFLYHMVRRMVFLQVLVGTKRISPEVFSELLGNERKAPAGNAPAAGLELKACFYEADWQEKIDGLI